MTTHEPAASERDGLFHEPTTSICPFCKTTLDTQVNVRDDQIKGHVACWHRVAVRPAPREYR